MTFNKQLNRLNRIDKMVRTRSTGTPLEFAHSLGISQSQLFNVLNYLKSTLHAPISYSKTAQSYYYTEDVKFVCAFLSNTENF